MPNYELFMSGGQYTEMSKGPKSIYYGLGDEDLNGVVLPVPQTDADDEWGRTLRIALELMVDNSSTMWRDIYDPANGSVGGLMYKVNTEILGILDPTAKTLTLNGVILNGVLGTVSVGNTKLSQGSLVNGPDFSLETVSAQTILRHKPSDASFSSIVMFSDGVGEPYINFVLGGVGTWQLKGGSLTGPAGSTVNIGSLGLSGTLSITNLVGTGTVTICGGQAGSLMFVDNSSTSPAAVTATFQGSKSVVVAQSPNPSATYYSAIDNAAVTLFVVRKSGGVAQVGINNSNPAASLHNVGDLLNWGPVTICGLMTTGPIEVTNPYMNGIAVFANATGLNGTGLYVYSAGSAVLGVRTRVDSPSAVYYEARDVSQVVRYIVQLVGGETRLGVGVAAPTTAVDVCGVVNAGGGFTGPTAILTTATIGSSNVGTIVGNTASFYTLSSGGLFTVCGNITLDSSAILTFGGTTTIVGNLVPNTMSTQTIGRPQTGNKWAGVYADNFYGDRGQFDRVEYINQTAAPTNPAYGNIFMYWENSSGKLKLRNSAGDTAEVTIGTFT